MDLNSRRARPRRSTVKVDRSKGRSLQRSIAPKVDRSIDDVTPIVKVDRFIDDVTPIVKVDRFIGL